ncbi:MAG: site-specific integrase [Myxococcales bacterium]|nr:MAG: site-specific integrase [Myxococcales bacterium]
MASRPLTGREQARLKAMNRQLYPARLRVLWTGAFQLDYRKKGQVFRRVVGHELEEAYERALLIRKNLDGLPVISARDVTLTDWHSQWMQGRGNLAESTKDVNSYYWAAIPELLKSKRLNRITEEDVRTVLAVFDKPVMQENVGAYLSTCFKAAVKAKLLVESPWSQSKKRRKKAMVILSPEELKKVFEAASPSTRAGLALAGFCGLRLEEIMGLRCEDVDTEKRIIYVRRARLKIFGRNSREVVKDTKTGKPRVVPIPQIALPFIPLSVKDRKGEEYLYPKYRKDFPNRLRTACRQAGVQRVTMHELRHVCGSNLMMTGGVAVAQAVLGHSQINTTVDIYGHLNSSYLVRQMELANGLGEEGIRLTVLATKFIEHDDPEIREMAVLAVQVCQKMSK